MSQTEQSESEGGGGAEHGESSGIVREIAAMALAAFVLVFGASIAAQFVAFVSRYLYLIVALVFLGLPLWWLERNEWDFRRFGLTTQRFWRNTALGLGLAVLTAAPFAVGFWVWESYAVGSTYSFEWENYRRWDPQLEGEPKSWGDRSGIWIWTEKRHVRVGLRAGDAANVPWRIELSGDRPFGVESTGRVEVRPVSEAGAEAKGERDGSGRASRWRVTVSEPNRRAQLTVRPAGAGTAAFPTSFEVSTSRSASAYPIHRGPGARRVEARAFSLHRGYRWLYLWAMTQLLFIALPEEYFYRGYLQTRVADAIEARRGGDDEGPGETRRWLGVSEQNVIASVAFGIGHLLTPVGGAILWNRIGVVFPSVVFGWLRDRTGTITAPVVYHAACNMLVLLAEPHFF